MSTSPRMGRGLDALWGTKSAKEGKSIISHVPINSLIPNPNQPRKQFDEESLKELASSIIKQGIIQPILVRQKAQSKNYEIVAGERRWRAAQIAKLTEVPVFIRELSDEDVMAAALIENIQREDLNPIEEALALRNLRDVYGITQEDLASRIGKSRSSLANSIRLLLLPPAIQDALVNKVISSGHARVLLSLQGHILGQDLLYKGIINKHLSVRDTENALEFYKKHNDFPWLQRDYQEQEAIKANSSEISEDKSSSLENQEQSIQIISNEKRSNRKKSTYLKNLQSQIKEYMFVKTNVSGDENKGKITLSYTNADELSQILDRIGIKAEQSNSK